MNHSTRRTAGCSATSSPTCENCGAPMRWEMYTCARRPDDLRQRDERAPVDWAWHCRCGMWQYATWGLHR